MCHLPPGETKFVHFSENKRTFGNWLFILHGEFQPGLKFRPAYRVTIGPHCQVHVSARDENLVAITC